jgi:hypothetical protein
LETWPSSVGSIAPPPVLTITLQTPQLPLPPQAEGMKILLSLRVLSRVVPAGTRSAALASPLIVIVTASVFTSLALAAISTKTSRRMTKVNIATPRMIVVVIVVTPRLEDAA